MIHRISSRTSFDRFGQTYDVTRIINEDSTLNVAKYEAYSPLFLSTTFALSYGLSFASITSTLMHTFLYFRKQIWVQSRRSMSEQPDIHARLMSRYPQVPEWWYATIFGESSWIPAQAGNSLARFSLDVYLRYHFHRGVAHSVPGLGVCPGSHHLYVFCP